MKNTILTVICVAVAAALVGIGCNDSGTADSEEAKNFLNGYNQKPDTSGGGGKDTTGSRDTTSEPAKIYYTLAINTAPDTGVGIVSWYPNIERFEAGDTVTITAAEKKVDFTFDKWSGALNDDTNSVTVTMRGNMALTAHFRQKTYTLTVNADRAGGSASRKPAKAAYNHGDTVEVSATPKNGYEFTGWTDAEGNTLGTENSLSIKVNENITLFANFTLNNPDDTTTTPPEETYYTLTAQPTNGGTVMWTPDGPEYTPEEIVTIVAIANDGYEFTAWINAANANDTVSTKDTLKIEMNSDMSLTANFTAKTYTLTATAEPTGSGNFSNNLGYEFFPHGTAVTVNAIAEPNYKFVNWKNIDNSADSLKITMTSDTTLIAVFEKTDDSPAAPPTPKYRLTVTTDPSGNGNNVKREPDITIYDDSTTVKVTAIPGQNYEFKNWSGAAKGETDTVTITMTRDTTLTANFVPKKYTITLNANGGTVSPSSLTTNNQWKLDSLPTPTKTDSSIFIGWYMSLQYTTLITENKYSFSKDTTIFAKWGGKATPKKGELKDERDGKTYKTVDIGTQTWMAENLNYNVPDNETDVCYGDEGENCEKYGRLYNWKLAMGEDSNTNASSGNVQGVCPTGWHLPSRLEWETLWGYVGGFKTAGTMLKSDTGWDSHTGTPVGKDAYGFSALPGGFYKPSEFLDSGKSGYWWTTETNSVNNYPYRGTILHNKEEASSASYISSTYRYSVRCVQNE